MNGRIKGKKRTAGAVSLLLILSLIGTACLKTPEVEYVTNKEGQNSLISDNKTGDGGISIAEQVNIPERAEGTCEKVNEYTAIEIDAKVMVPEQTAVPIYSVVPREVSEESLKNYTESLYGAGKFHNRTYSRYGYAITRTEEEIYDLIETYTGWLDSAAITDTPEPVFDENDNMIEMNEEDERMYRDQIESLRDELLRLEEAPTYGDPVTYEFTPQTETLYLRGDETVECEYESATYTGEYNGKEYDLSVFRDGRNTEIDFELRKGTILKNGYDINQIGWQANYERGHGSIAEKNNSCQYSQEEAVDLCREFLTELGIENMNVGYVDDLHLLKWDSGNEIYLGNKGYYCYFYWGNGNMGDSYASGEDDYLAQWTAQDTTLLPLQAVESSNDAEEDYQLDMYRGIAIFTVLDDGIVRAWIQNPVENRELQAENVKLLDFDQVLKQGMAYMETLYGDSGTSDPGGYQDIVIRSIELHYARMQAPNNENEFTMIPVWDFKEFEDGRIMLSINAIDGSRFDREKGY